MSFLQSCIRKMPVSIVFQTTCTWSPAANTLSTGWNSFCRGRRMRRRRWWTSSGRAVSTGCASTPGSCSRSQTRPSWERWPPILFYSIWHDLVIYCTSRLLLDEAVLHRLDLRCFAASVDRLFYLGSKTILDSSCMLGSFYIHRINERNLTCVQPASATSM